MKNIFMEQEIALLLGWFGIVPFENGFIGYPPGTDPKKSFRQHLPQYTRNVQDSEKLAKDFNITVHLKNQSYHGDIFVAHIKDYPNAQGAKMNLIAMEVIELLEDYQQLEE